MLAAAGETCSQMCCGMIGTHMLSRSALGRLQTIRTVVGSRAVALLMPKVEFVKFAIWFLTM